MTDLFHQDLDNVELDPDKKYLEELVGEGKKFSDPEALARGKAESDQFIERLKGELSGIRNELNTRVKMEEFLDKLNTLPKESPTNGQQPSVREKEDNLGTPDLDKLLDAKLQEREQLYKATHNVEQVQQKLQEHLGPNYANKLEQIAQNLKLSKDFLNSVARTSPEAFLKLVGVEQRGKQDIFSSPPKNQVNTDGFRPNSTGKDWDYFQDLKKKDSVKYWSTTVQNEMHDLRRKGLLKLPSDIDH